MKHGQADSSSHPSHVSPHHGASAWLGIVAILLAICGVAAIYYYRRCRSSYRKKRRVTRRAQSAAELSPSAVACANKRVSFRTRSVSSEQRDESAAAAAGAPAAPDTERTPLVKDKIDSLARLLLRRATGGRWKDEARSSYRKKRRVTRRAQSAAELSPSAVACANKRVSFRTRSVSSEQRDESAAAAAGAPAAPDTERTPLVKDKIDSLARLLLRRATGGRWKDEARSSYRKKRRVTRRAQSAAELSPSAVACANKRVSFRTRSVSSEQRDESAAAAAGAPAAPDTERTPLVKDKIDSLARLLLRRATGGRWKDEARQSPRYHYSALDASGDGYERLELSRRARSCALAVCRRYLAQTPRYELLRHLNDVGSRIDKHWFVVRDVSVKTDRLLSLVPVCSGCAIPCNQTSRDIIIELFQNLQHPYIYPVLDFEFTEVEDSGGAGGGLGVVEDEPSDLHAVLLMPFNTEGSLKDLIYGSNWQDDWSHKYGRRSPGLPLSQIQRLGRQILEALLFLRERGFPSYGHLHSGNVILQNGVARLAGLENTLLGYKSRCHGVVWRRASASPQHVDIICFGHVLFEMAAGYELSQPQPSPGHLQLDLERCPQVVDVLDLIFQPPIMDASSSEPSYRYPSLEELLVCELFRYVDLREMRGAGAMSVRAHRLPHAVRALLDDVRRPKRACASEPSSPVARERRIESPRYALDDCSLSDDPCGGEALQHRELLLHLSRPTQPLSPPLCGGPPCCSAHQPPALLAVR